MKNNPDLLDGKRWIRDTSELPITANAAQYLSRMLFSDRDTYERIVGPVRAQLIDETPFDVAATLCPDTIAVHQLSQRPHTRGEIVRILTAAADICDRMAA